MNANASRPNRAPVKPAADPCQVSEADLKRIDDISALLLTFNDPRAGADVLSRHVERIPVLKARVLRSFEQRHPGRYANMGEPTSMNIGQMIALLGNRQLESILFELLEDIVTLSSGAR
jgi:hypothetical protein